MNSTVSLVINHELYALAKAYAAEREISFSRFVSEVLYHVLELSEKFPPELKARVEQGIHANPGRRTLSIEDIRQREIERQRIKNEAHEAREKAKEAARLARQKKIMERYSTIAEIDEQGEGEE